MLIPWNTDAPIYHFPWATLGVIGVNLGVFAMLIATGGEGFDNYVLIYGDGLHPIQWVTALFLHGGIGHVVGNMIFLWAFGLVVEGKLGWWRFLIAYLGLGIVQNAAEQSMTFWFNEGGSIGASGAIYGLLAMCLVWAPENEMSCILWLGWWRPFFLEITIFWLTLWYIGFEAFIVWWTEFAVGSSLLHAFGAVLGFALGTTLLKLDRVDCEGWDLFSIMAKQRGGVPARSTRRKHFDRVATMAADAPAEESAESGKNAADRYIAAQTQFRRLLKEGKASAAHALYEKTSHFATNWQLAEKELLMLIDGLSTEKMFNEAVPFLEDYLRRFQKREPQVRLKLAQILIEHQQRPSYATRVLADLPKAGLSDNHAKLAASLERKARKMIDDGVLELEGRAW